MGPAMLLCHCFCLYGRRAAAESPPSPSIPPEVLRHISEWSRTDLKNQFFQNQLTPLDRWGLFALGILILLAGIFLCRRLAVGCPHLIHGTGVWGLLGLFGAVAALCFACAAVGVIALHLAPAACTVVSGFSIAAFLLPQFNLTKNWILPNSTSDPTPPQNHLTHN